MKPEILSDPVVSGTIVLAPIPDYARNFPPESVVSENSIAQQLLQFAGSDRGQLLVAINNAMGWSSLVLRIERPVERDTRSRVHNFSMSLSSRKSGEPIVDFTVCTNHGGRVAEPSFLTLANDTDVSGKDYHMFFETIRAIDSKRFGEILLDRAQHLLLELKPVLVRYYNPEVRGMTPERLAVVASAYGRLCLYLDHELFFPPPR
jgi:hypothetical protein